MRCFHCGIGLRNWEEDDDPYVEHCRWSPNCQYMKLKKGQAFIDAVQDAVRQVQLVCILWKLKLNVYFLIKGLLMYTNYNTKKEILLVLIT